MDYYYFFFKNQHRKFNQAHIWNFLKRIIITKKLTKHNLINF